MLRSRQGTPLSGNQGAKGHRARARVAISDAKGGVMAERAVQSGNEPSVDELREEIDRIDSQLLAMLNRRTDLALTIGRVKHAQRLPVHVPERERAILARLEALNTGPLPNDAVGEIFEKIMSQMRKMEERLRH